MSAGGVKEDLPGKLPLKTYKRVKEGGNPNR